MTYPLYFLRDLYQTKNEFLLYDRLHGIAARLGYATPEDAWEANPSLEDVWAVGETVG